MVVPGDLKMITVKGEAYGRSYDYACELVSRTSEDVAFETKSEPKHHIRLTPRYVGSQIGSNDFEDKDGQPTTICAFYFDGEYAALAFYQEKGKDIKIVPHEH